MALMLQRLLMWTVLAAGDLIAPVPLTPAQVPTPADTLIEPLVVRARIEISASGAVERVQLLDGPSGPWGMAVLEAAAGFAFKPALVDGEPVAAGIVFTQTFLPGAVVPPAELDIQIVEKGTRRKLVGAAVSVNGADSEFKASADDLGQIVLRLPAGTVQVHANLSGYRPFAVQETLRAGQTLKVRYLLERLSYNDYETLVISTQERTELTRTSLAGSEIYQVPGTFGDPFRVVSTLPGVGTMFSLLGYTIVRGTSPSSTAFMVDEVAVPQLFHFLVGPSVMHPNFIERVDFYPGNFPVRYGGYIGGIVDGITRRAGADEKKVEIDLDLLQAGAFLRGPIAGGYTATVAGRYGYPGLLLKALQVPINLQYWDYQGRVDGPLGNGRLKIFAFGSSDTMRVDSQGDAATIGIGFHRIDLGWQSENDGFYQSYALILGLDQTKLTFDKGGVDLQGLTANPRARWRMALSDTLALRWGLDVAWTAYQGSNGFAPGNDNQRLQSAGVLIDAPWWPHPDVQIVAGLRVDQYANQSVNQISYNPRLGVRWRMLSLDDDNAVWLKLGLGHFNEPPRLLIPLPGLEAVALRQGLSSSSQAMVGTELPLTEIADLDLQVYYNDMDRLIYDTSVNADPSLGSAAPDDLLGILVGSPQPKSGRSYGLEILLKRHNQGSFFGWLSYTLSRSERCHGGGSGPLCRGGEFVTFDYDRTHMLQLVGGWRLPRGWQVGGRLQLASGRPLTGPQGYNTTLAPPFYRLDIRIDRRVVYEQFLFDFYVDIINTTLSPEYLAGPDTGVPYLLPTFGLRAEI